MNWHNPPQSEAEHQELLECYAAQHREIQVAWDVKVTCPICKRGISITDHAYRCFHCGLWFCRQCAAVHFAETGYRGEQAMNIPLDIDDDDDVSMDDDDWAEFARADSEARMRELAKLATKPKEEAWRHTMYLEDNVLD